MDYKFVVMCGGKYTKWDKPRQMIRINGEMVIERTIRLLRENGVTNIAISTNDDSFEQFGLPILRHENDFVATEYIVSGQWVHAFYPTVEPVCYIFGDVYFSPEAIKTIVETETTDIQFFASAPPFSEKYTKPWAEPFALKVRNTTHLKEAIAQTVAYWEEGQFMRKPIMWELWQVIKGTTLNKIYYDNYIAINDYTVDIDCEDDALRIESILRTP